MYNVDNWTHENLAISAYLIPHMNFRLTEIHFAGPFKDFFTICNNIILIVVRQEVSNFDSSVVVHDLELAINRSLYGCFCRLGGQ